MSKRRSRYPLEKLIQKERNICHICNKKCDSTDFTYVNGSFKAGHKYPTRDHLVPLSKGGANTIDNLKLAHYICNCLRQDTIIAELKICN